MEIQIKVFHRVSYSNRFREMAEVRRCNFTAGKEKHDINKILV